MWEQGMIVIFIAVNQGKARQNLPLVAFSCHNYNQSSIKQHSCSLHTVGLHTHNNNYNALHILYCDIRLRAILRSIFHSVYAFSY